jgi:PEP-CTERM motif-containing protein
MESRILGLLAVALTGISRVALSDPITYDFTVTATNGPLAGDVASGSFTFDSSIIPAGGGTVSQIGLLTDLSFTWDGIAYTSATANTGWLLFNSAGTLEFPVFGTDCHPGSCNLAQPPPPTDGWSIGGRGFFYDLPSSSTPFFVGTVSYFPDIAAPHAVPEPAILSLLGLGFAGLGFMRRRKRN